MPIDAWARASTLTVLDDPLMVPPAGDAAP